MGSWGFRPLDGDAALNLVDQLRALPETNRDGVIRAYFRDAAPLPGWSSREEAELWGAAAECRAALAAIMLARLIAGPGIVVPDYPHRGSGLMDALAGGAPPPTLQLAQEYADAVPWGTAAALLEAAREALAEEPRVQLSLLGLPQARVDALWAEAAEERRALVDLADTLLDRGLAE